MRKNKIPKQDSTEDSTVKLWNHRVESPKTDSIQKANLRKSRRLKK